MTEIADLGEFGLITRIRRAAGTPPPPEGPGDDAAVVAAPGGRVVVTTDLLVEGVHFRREWSSPYDIGRKAAAQNLADVAAMGARPTRLLIALGAPARLTLEEFDAFIGGVRAECERAGAQLVGGDLTAAPQLVVSGTALGAPDGEPVLRSGARPGDLIGVVGRLGWAAAGLRELRGGALDGVLVYAHRRPLPPYAAGPALAAAGATAMCDVSDGLLGDLGHIVEASGVTADLRLADLRRLGTDGVTDDDLLAGGEDHALLFTIPPGAELPDDAVIIGEVGAPDPERPPILVDGQTPSAEAFAHFRG
jgi:thiamine-monophosphate kinase